MATVWDIMNAVVYLGIRKVPIHGYACPIVILIVDMVIVLLQINVRALEATCGCQIVTSVISFQLIITVLSVRKVSNLNLFL
jgi:hypothetical protein